MTVTRITRLIAVVLFSSFVSTAAAFAADDAPTLTRAKDLYQSAAYEDALHVLDGLRSDQSAPDRTEVAEYRAFCLLALQRNEDAQQAIAGIVSTNPFYQPSEALASPRIRAVFRDVRQSVLPTLVQTAYTEAKAAFERKDPHAADDFDRVLALLDDPDVKAIPSLADLRTVAVGFRDLSRALAASAPPGQTAGAPVGAIPSSNTARQPEPKAAGSAEPELASAVVPTAPPSEAAATTVASTPPVGISQPMPRWAPSQTMTRPFVGALEITIDQDGNVSDARLQRSVYPGYDAELLKAARTWRFKPATRNGVPVPSTKVIEIRLQPPN